MLSDFKINIIRKKDKLITYYIYIIIIIKFLKFNNKICKSHIFVNNIVVVIVVICRVIGFFRNMHT